MYDIIEAIAAKTRQDQYSHGGNKFETELNEYFVENGIGWKLRAAGGPAGWHLHAGGASSESRFAKEANHRPRGSRGAD